MRSVCRPEIQSSGVDGTGRDDAYLLGVLRQPNLQLVGLLSLQQFELARPLQNALVKVRAHRVDRLSELGSLRTRLLRGRCKRGELCGEIFDVVVGDIERRLEMLQGNRQLEVREAEAQGAGRTVCWRRMKASSCSPRLPRKSCWVERSSAVHSPIRSVRVAMASRAATMSE